MNPPRIDNRSLPDLIEQMKEMVPYYTPEWRFSPDDPDPGTALFLIFAEMFQNNIERLNRVPLKNFIAFLNMLDVSQLSAKPAHAYVTFQLSVGTREPVLVRKGTQVSAKAQDGGDDIIFETDSAFMLTNATLVDLYQVSSQRDLIQRVDERLLNSEGNNDAAVALFEFRTDDNLQEHTLYFGHEDLFLLKGASVIELNLFNTQARYKQVTYGERLANGQHVEWLYGAADGWHLFDEVRAEGNRLLLKKKAPIEIVPQEINGITNRWIMCRVKPAKLDLVSPKNDELLLDGVQIKSESLAEDQGLVPEMLFFNDMQLDPAGCYPFGEFFAPYGLFYICNEEVFSKRNSWVTLQFTLKAIRNRLLHDDGPPINWKPIMKQSDLQRPKVFDISILNVLWEYWNGKSWVRLFHNSEYETIFYNPSETDAAEKTISFECPYDLQETFVNGQYSYWIRARVMQIENLYASNPYYLSPWMGNLRLNYEYGGRTYPVEACVTGNNLELLNRTGNVTTTPAVLFAPFYSLDSKHPALYFGFETPPVKGPIHMYVSVKQQKYAESELPIIEWEYLRQNGSTTEWATLKAIDETHGLSRSGTVQFVGPSDMVRGHLFQRDLYWLRVVNRDDKWERTSPKQPLPVLNGIHLNTTRATQQESIQWEEPQKVVHDTGDEYVLVKTPVYSEEVWVDETGRLTEGQIQALVEADDSKINIIRDAEGKILKLWIVWSPVEHFDDSGSEDRHYLINRASGRFQFGDGKQGKMLPNRGADKVRVNYKVIVGARGNVEAREITTLRKSIAFVNSVSNPEPSGGGCDIEPLENALRRGPQMIRHRNKAITAEDYEWLARQAHQDIAKVKCLPGMNVNLERQSGSITLAVLPKGGQAAMHFFPALKEEVEEYLLERAPSTIAFDGNIQVIEPAYLEVSILAHLVARDIDLIVPIELEAVEKLNRFLDPLTGNYDGQGWNIGQQLHPSVFYGLLKSIKGVNFVQKLSMSVTKIEDGQRREIAVEQMGDIPHGIVVNGRHTVVVDA